MSSQKKRVIIIGAGISGLSCARQLAQYHKEIDITLLEASDRIGGRVRSYTAEDGTVLELGAQFIHGTVGNPIYDFAVEKGIIDVSKEHEDVDDNAVHYFHKMVTSSEKEKMQAVVQGEEYRRKVIANLVDGKETPIEKSIGEYMKRKFDELTEKHTAIDSVLNFWILEEANINGCSDLDNLDLKSFTVYNDLDGNLEFMQPGCYQRIIDAIYADIPPNILRINHKVTGVDFSKGKGLSVFCDNGATFECDIAVLTVSLEVLKHLIKKGTFFIPPLPSEKSRALTHMKLGRVVKFFFKFQRPFPDQEVCRIYVYPTSDYLAKTPFSEIGLLDRIDSSDWWMIWINGRLLEEFDKSTDEYQFLIACLDTMKQNFPNFPKDLEIDPGHIVTTNWTKDPQFLGGYSYFECGGNAREDIEVLRRPVTFENELGRYDLLISGEITEEKHYSTTHAAFESGIRDGKLIAEILQLKHNVTGTVDDRSDNSCRLI